MWVGGMGTQLDTWQATSPSEKGVRQVYENIFFFGSWGPRTLSDLQVCAFLFISHRNIPLMECPSWPCPDKCLFIPKTSVIMSPLRSLLDFCLLQAELTTPAFVLLQLLMLSFVTEIITLWHNNVLPDFFHQAAVSWSKWILAFPS